MGLDSDLSKTQNHLDHNRKVFFADAEDPVFWERIDMPDVKAVVLAMNDIEAKVIAARKLRQCGFKGLIVAHTMFPDEAEAIRHAGADHAYLTFSEAGVGLAERVRYQIESSVQKQSSTS
jgi:Trk K+ transport system NAD-binding subunit